MWAPAHTASVCVASHCVAWYLVHQNHVSLRTCLSRLVEVFNDTTSIRLGTVPPARHSACIKASSFVGYFAVAYRTRAAAALLGQVVCGFALPQKSDLRWTCLIRTCRRAILRAAIFGAFYCMGDLFSSNL